MAILINAETQTVVVLDRHDRIDGNALALLSAQAVDRPPRAATGPRDYAAPCVWSSGKSTRRPDRGTARPRQIIRYRAPRLLWCRP